MIEKEEQYTDLDGNQIRSRHKIIAGLILIPLICACITLIIALWPDRIPPSNENYQSYCKIELFKVRVISIPNAAIDKVNQSSLYLKQVDTAKVKQTQAQKKSDSVKKENQKDSAASKKTKEQIVKELAETVAKAEAAMKAQGTNTAKKDCCCCNQSTAAGATTIQADEKVFIPGLIDPKEFERLSSLNLLFLTLVVLGGFLGNLIHITSSLTNYIGSGQFKRSWWFWYIAKPFVASGLALAVYFALCGGFLSINNSANNINIVGVMIISILSGLFADRTTLKLKEVFEVLLRPKEDRSDKLVGDPKVTGVNPLVVLRNANAPTSMTITGENFAKENLILTIGDQPVDMMVTPTKITFSYQMPANLPADAVVMLILKTTKGVILSQEQLVFM
ncbi:hypothetical protein [Pedobacter aquatilis]|uniref:hypothetical protein n=1 Tax=Pedobacter aquatilis TaxID=351343 RepID=UPI00292E014E|nr:hypothetical protein [Pedobacter aquatilis]